MNTRLILAACLIFITFVTLPTTGAAAVDPYPNACVSCHVVVKDKGQALTYLSSQMQEFAKDLDREDPGPRGASATSE